MTLLPLPGMHVPPETILVGNKPIPCREVEVIIGEMGISLSGGEMLIWKRNIVIAGGRRHVSRGSADHRTEFEQWRGVCPGAIAIRPDGSVILPQIASAAHEDPLAVLGNALATVRKELFRQILKAFASAFAMLAAGLAVVIACIAYNVAHPKQMAGFKAIVAGIVFIVCAVLLGIRGMILLGRRNRIVRVLKGILSRGQLDAGMLAHALAPRAAIAADGSPIRQEPPIPMIAAVLAGLSLALMLCPFVGLVVSAITLALTFRRRSWARTMAIVGLVASAAVTVFALIMANR